MPIGTVPFYSPLSQKQTDAYWYSTTLQPHFLKSKRHLLVQYHFVAPLLKNRCLLVQYHFTAPFLKNNRCLLVQYHFTAPFLKIKETHIGTVPFYTHLSKNKMRPISTVPFWNSCLPVLPNNFWKNKIDKFCELFWRASEYNTINTGCWNFGW